MGAALLRVPLCMARSAHGAEVRGHVAPAGRPLDDVVSDACSALAPEQLELAPMPITLQDRGSQGTPRLRSVE